MADWSHWLKLGGFLLGPVWGLFLEHAQYSEQPVPWAECSHTPVHVNGLSPGLKDDTRSLGLSCRSIQMTTTLGLGGEDGGPGESELLV